jgi:hypothetical protein
MLLKAMTVDSRTIWVVILCTSSWEDRLILGGSSVCCLLHTYFLLILFFELEDGGDMFLRKVRLLSTDYMMLFQFDYS